jgi:hypothetical protein
MKLLGFQLLEFTPTGVLCLVGWAIAAWALAKALFRDDRMLMAMRREANELAQTLGQWGFSVIPKLLTDFAIGDVVTLTNDFRNAADTFKDPKKVRTELEKLVNNMVTEELKDTTTRQAFVDGVVSKAAAVGVYPSKPGATANTAPTAAQPHVTNVTVHAPGAAATTLATAATEAAAK